jgi:hypothetical protein
MPGTVGDGEIVTTSLVPPILQKSWVGQPVSAMIVDEKIFCFPASWASDDEDTLSFSAFLRLRNRAYDIRKILGLAEFGIHEDFQDYIAEFFFTEILKLLHDLCSAGPERALVPSNPLIVMNRVELIPHILDRSRLDIKKSSNLFECRRR